MFFPAIGRLCEKDDGKCVICDSYVRPCTLVRICDECNYGSYQGRCVICGGPGVSDAYYCKECTIQEKDVSEFKENINYFSTFNMASDSISFNLFFFLNYSEMDAQRSLTWVVQRRISSTNGRSLDSNKDSLNTHSIPLSYALCHI